jgi:hypothetical protein
MSDKATIRRNMFAYCHIGNKVTGIGGDDFMNGGQKTWLGSLTVEALERFSEDMMAAVENGEDKERQRFYEGMAVASKLAAMKLKGEFAHIDEEFIHHVYENMKMLYKFSLKFQHV